MPLAGPPISLHAKDLLRGLPVFSPVAIKLMDLVSDENVSLKQVAKLFSVDPVLAGQVLRLANSGMYGRQIAVQSVLQAVARLGLTNITRIAITAALSCGFPRATSPWRHAWWRHSIAAALIADHVGIVSLGLDFGYTAGLLHAVGQLALYQHAPRDYPGFLDAVDRANADVLERERERFGADHAQLGSLMLSEWGLPSPLRVAISDRHAPSGADTLAAAVQAGCYYAEAQGFGPCGCRSGLCDVHPGRFGKTLDRYLLDVLAIEVNRIEWSLSAAQRPEEI